MNPAFRQRGAATLGITLLLLFVVLLVAGVANRNLIFEQKTSANQARSTDASLQVILTGLRWLGALAPFGGAALISGWLALAWSWLRG